MLEDHVGLRGLRLKRYKTRARQASSVKVAGLEIARVCASQRNVSLRMESLTTSFSTFSPSLSPSLSLSSPRIPVTAHVKQDTNISSRASNLLLLLLPLPPKDESTCRMRRGASSVIKTLLSLYALCVAREMHLLTEERNRERIGGEKEDAKSLRFERFERRRGRGRGDAHLDLSAGRLCNYFSVPVYCTRGQDRVPVLSAPFRLP